MILEHTRLVSHNNGPRPAGKPDECFYCYQPLGENHKEDCVLFRRVAMVKIELVIPMDYPVGFDASNIDFHLNDSSWCANNLLGRLARLGASGCLCNVLEGYYLREATPNDLDLYPEVFGE